MSESPLRVLLVEDDEIDRLGVQRAFRREQMGDQLVTAEDGVEALERLRGEGANEGMLRPYVILLDLNMPRMSGLEFLAELRADAALADSVVFVLTTSDTEKDVRSAFDRSVAGYFVKSKLDTNYANLIDVVQSYSSLAVFPKRLDVA